MSGTSAIVLGYFVTAVVSAVVFATLMMRHARRTQSVDRWDDLAYSAAGTALGVLWPASLAVLAVMVCARPLARRRP